MEVEAAQSPEGRNPEKPACLPHGTQKAGALGGSHSEGQQEQETAQPQSPSPQPPAQTLLQKSSRGSPSAGWPTWRAGEHPDLGTPCPLPVLALRQENWGLLSGEGAWPREQMLDTDTARRPSEAPTNDGATRGSSSCTSSRAGRDASGRRTRTVTAKDRNTKALVRSKKGNRKTAQTFQIWRSMPPAWPHHP